MRIRIITIIILYNLFLLFIFPFFLPYFLYRLFKKKETSTSLVHRFGILPSTPASHNVIWLHAISVGEVLSLRFLINEIKKKDSSVLCYVTTGTLLGEKIAQEQLNADFVAFAPLDFLPFLMCAFKKIKPTALLIAEAELWPNLLWYAQLQGVSTYWINGRIKTSKNKVKSWFHKTVLIPCISLFTHVYLQSKKDASYLVLHSIPQPKITVLGNLKIVSVVDAYKKEIAITQARRTQFPCILAGSLHSGELPIVLNAYRSLKKIYSHAHLIVAPRHFTWIQHLYKTLDQYQLSYQQFSKNFSDTASITVVDTMGALFSLYQQADLFILGGTFVPIGGHNLLEPAVWGVPTIVGPYYHATQHIAEELRKSGGVMVVNNEDVLSHRLVKIIEDQQLTRAMSSAQKKWINENYETVHSIITTALLPSLIHSKKSEKV